MLDQSSSSSPQPKPSPSKPNPPMPTPVAPAEPTNPGGAAQRETTLPLPISPFTNQPYNPAWGTLIKKGDGEQPTIQQIMKPEIERKADQ